MNEKKVISLCQLANRAGKISKGDALIGSIQNKKAKLVVYASSTGENRKKKLKDKCSFYQVECLELDPAAAEKIFPDGTNSFGITDSGFASAILKEVKG